MPQADTVTLRQGQPDPAAAPAPKVLTGSVGPKSLAVTGQLADGWIGGSVQQWDEIGHVAAGMPASVPGLLLIAAVARWRFSADVTA
jgi:hypothetical protein